MSSFQRVVRTGFRTQSCIHKMCMYSTVPTAGEKNISLRRNIVERILRIYHATCRNLTVVNDNLSRNQATIEVRWNTLPPTLCSPLPSPRGSTPEVFSLPLTSVPYSVLSPLRLQKVNSQLKKADQDLERTNTSMKLITEESCTFAPTLRMEIPQHWKSADSKAAGSSSGQATASPTPSPSQKPRLTSVTIQTS